MRQIGTLVFLSIGLAACAGGSGPAATTPSTTVASVAPVTAPIPLGDASQPDSDIHDRALRAGYKQQISGGEVMYCHGETPLGTRFPETTCLNAAQLSARFNNADQTRDNLRRASAMTEAAVK